MKMGESRSDQAERLRQARLATKGYADAAAAARAMGVKVPTYLGHENGSRGFASQASRYADFYRVNLDWLLTGRGRMKRGDFVEQASTEKPSQIPVSPDNELFTPQDIHLRSLPRDVPILGSAACGEDGVFELNGQTVDFAKRWPRLVGIKDLYALHTDGESMWPWREHGELVYVAPHQPVKIGDHVVVQLIDEPGNPHSHRAYIKRLERRTEKELRLHQYNPAESINIAMRRVKSIHRVIPWSELSA